MSAGLLAFLIALSASLVLTVPVRALAIRVGMVDLPGPRKVNLKPIPLLGGLAIYGGVMMAILIAFDGAARAQSFGIVTVFAGAGAGRRLGRTVAGTATVSCRHGRHRQRPRGRASGGES